MCRLPLSGRSLVGKDGKLLLEGMETPASRAHTPITMFLKGLGFSLSQNRRQKRARAYHSLSFTLRPPVLLSGVVCSSSKDSCVGFCLSLSVGV